MRKSLPAVLAIALAATAVFAGDPPPQKPGKWQIKMQMEIPGMPVKMPPITSQVCLTEEDLKDPQKSVPGDPKNPCTIIDYKIDGNVVTWTSECPKQKSKGKGRITFDGDSYDGVIDLLIGEQEMTMKLSGVWKGECEK